MTALATALHYLNLLQCVLRHRYAPTKVLVGCSNSLTIFVTSQNQHSDIHAHFTKRYDGGAEEAKYARINFLSQALSFILHIITSVTFVCTTKCNTMNASKERLSESVRRYPRLRTASWCGHSEQIQTLLDVVGRHVI